MEKIKKHKNKMIAGVVVAAALAIAWFAGSNYPGANSAPPAALSYATPSDMLEITDISDINVLQSETTHEPTDAPLEFTTISDVTDIFETSTAETAESSEEITEPTIPDITEFITQTQAQTMTETPASTQIQIQTQTQPQTTKPTITTESPTTLTNPSIQPPTTTVSTTEKPTTQPPTAAPTQPPTTTQPPTQDKYLTDPVPEGKPTPVEPQDMIVGDGTFTVTLTVRCDTILNNMNWLNKEKHELVPDDGVIFPLTTVTVNEGESVFNVLQREMRRAQIHMVFRNTPIYNSAYIEAINNLYEFDAGSLSGWMYCVNDWYPNYGCSRYLLQPGDVIEWRYTCDLGRDLGQDWIS